MLHGSFGLNQKLLLSGKEGILNHQELPYERFLAYGPGSLTNAELLAVILRTGTANVSATELARQVLTSRDPDNTGLSVLYDLTMKDLLAMKGIGEVKAVKLLCLSELSRRISMEKASEKLSFCCPEAVSGYYMELLRHEKQEKTFLLLLDNKMALIREILLTIGTVNSTLLSPRDIYIRALREGAVSIILLHNHPSGDPTPSRMDIEMTNQICLAGRLLDIELADHLIIGDNCYVSMRESGYLESSDD
ncbi:MAG: DNA repair protein RadC [Lachnospiraceae bacterium]|nr:DNA repair protein RadC [Lachnospiraceae bacterium]MBQ4304321.1 DNA repair protein RadC [Lachnospiraceae bacterium]